MAFNEFQIGKRERISWVDETSYGTGGDMESDGEIVGLNARMEPDFNQNWQEILTAGADDRYVQDRVVGPESYPFTLVFTPVNWKVLKYCGYSVSTTGSDPYTHTFSLSNSVQSFKLEWARRHTSPHVLTLTGCVIKSLTISFSKATGAGEGMIELRASCVAQSVSSGSSVSSLSNITATPFQWRHAKFTLNGSVVTEVNNGEITIDNGINEDDSRYCNATLDRQIGEPIPTVHRLNGRVNVNVKDTTYYDLWAAATAVGSTNKLEFIRDTDDDLVMDMGSIYLPSGVPATNLEGVTALDLPFQVNSWSSLVATDSISTY